MFIFFCKSQQIIINWTTNLLRCQQFRKIYAIPTFFSFFLTNFRPCKYNFINFIVLSYFLIELLIIFLPLINKPIFDMLWVTVKTLIAKNMFIMSVAHIFSYSNTLGNLH